MIRSKFDVLNCNCYRSSFIDSHQHNIGKGLNYRDQTPPSKSRDIDFIKSGIDVCVKKTSDKCHKLVQMFHERINGVLGLIRDQVNSRNNYVLKLVVEALNAIQVDDTLNVGT